MIKRVDLAVYDAVRDVFNESLKIEDVTLGLKEHGVDYAPVRVELEGKAQILEKVEALRARVVSGALRVPTNAAELEAFSP